MSIGYLRLEAEFIVIMTILLAIFILLIRGIIITYKNNKKEKYPQEGIILEFEEQFEKIDSKEIEKISNKRKSCIILIFFFCIMGFIVYITLPHKTDFIETLLFLWPVFVVVVFANLYKKESDKLLKVKERIIEQLFENVKIDMFNFEEHYKEAGFDTRWRIVRAYNGSITFWGKLKNKYDYLYADILVDRDMGGRRRLFYLKDYFGFIKIAYDRAVDIEELKVPKLREYYSQFCNMNLSCDREYIYIRISGIEQHKFKNKLKNEIYKECLQIKLITKIAEDLIDSIEKRVELW